MLATSLLIVARPATIVIGFSRFRSVIICISDGKSSDNLSEYLIFHNLARDGNISDGHT